MSGFEKSDAVVRKAKKTRPAFAHSLVTDWSHSPAHRLTEGGAYMVTCGTYLKRHHFRGTERLRLLCDALHTLGAKYRWNLQAWAVFSNHYHFVGLSPPNAETLRPLISELHST